MTVGELIEELKKYDGGMETLVYNAAGGTKYLWASDFYNLGTRLFLG
jgi:hypothetical protein